MNLHQPEQQAPRQRRTLRVLQGCSMRVKIWRCLPFGPKRKAKNRLSPVYYVLALGRIPSPGQIGRSPSTSAPSISTFLFWNIENHDSKTFFKEWQVSAHGVIFFIKTRIGKKLLRSRIVFLGLPRICCQGLSIKDVSSLFTKWNCLRKSFVEDPKGSPISLL